MQHTIHLSIHRFMLSLLSNLNPCCLLQKCSFISIDSIIIPRQRSSIHCYYVPPFFTNSFFSSSSFPIRAKNFDRLSHIFHQHRELSILLLSILLEYLDRQLLFVPLLCFSMSRATVMDAFTRVRGNNQSLPAAPPNTQEKPECL